MKSIFGVLALIFVTSCASVKPAPTAMDEAAKRFVAIPGKASIYIFRDEMFGALLRREIAVDGKVLGVTGPNTFFWVSHAPGTCTINSEDDSNPMTLQLEAGKTYYIWQEIKMGLISGNTKLQIVDEKRGQEGVRSSRMIANEI